MHVRYSIDNNTINNLLTTTLFWGFLLLFLSVYSTVYIYVIFLEQLKQTM